jgi:hypothetical protein
MIGVEADLIGIESLGPVDIGDRDRDQFELEVHVVSPCFHRRGRPAGIW